MIQPIVNFFVTVFQWIGRGVGWFLGILLLPFVWLGNWYVQRGWILKLVVGVALIGLIALYANFIYVTQIWNGFNPNYVDKYQLDARNVSAGEQITAGAGGDTTRTCGRSGMVQVSADLTDFNVNQNAWITSMLLYKLGLFGMDWDNTPFLDNKASFQRGINEAVRRASVELVDNLGRIRTTSQIDGNLQAARNELAYGENVWYISANGMTATTPSVYRRAIENLRTFNGKLESCQAVFDARADNLRQFIDRAASAIGSTSAILISRAESSNLGVFDPRADDRFWFAYGQLYAYYGLMKGAQADFEDIIKQRNLKGLWDIMDQQFKASLRIQPPVVANSNEDGIFATHLTTMSAYILRVRSNMVEISNVLAQ